MADKTHPEKTALLLKRRLAVWIGAAVMALLLFAADLLSPIHGALAVLYIAVILLVAQASGQRTVLVTGLTCALLTVVAFISDHRHDPFNDAYVRLGVSLVAIAASTLLSMRDRFARATLEEQARVLELTHDTVIIRDPQDVILYWNDGAEKLYGWTRAEALGRRCREMLHCEFPPEVVSESLGAEGQWSGELSRTRRDGTRIVLASRWLMRRDPEGRSIGVIETSADLTEQHHANLQRQASERRYRTIFESAGFATWEADWSETMRIATESLPAGADLHDWLVEHPDLLRNAVSSAIIQNANQAAVDLFQVGSKQELVGSNLCGRYVPEAVSSVASILVALNAGDTSAESEARLITAHGSVADVVLRVTILPEGERWSRVLVMAFDVTERNEARAKLEQASAELAHAARVSTLGQLAASIAHEVNQPLSAIITYGKSGKRWLSREVPDTNEVAHCLDHIVANGSRAADVIARVRSLARKAAPQSEPLALPELIDEAIALVQREANAAQVSIRRLGADSLPLVIGDRVQIQQVVVNLLINGIQAMHAVNDRPRELCIELGTEAESMMKVAVRDCGTGIGGDDPARIFEPFFTTKADGMGMGLSICRSIIEAQGGRISAANNTDQGATIAFTLPTRRAETASVAEPVHTSV